MQQRVKGVRRAPPRTTSKTSVKAPPVPRRKISTAARVFYLMRWGYHFVTPIGMAFIVWGIIESATGDPSIGLPIIIGGGVFTYCANYFNKAR